MNKLDGGNHGVLSKSIIVNANRKQIMQSLGRYCEIMSHENIEQEFETVNNDDRPELADLYRLDDSYDSAV